jgi:hypothetical protein
MMPISSLTGLLGFQNRVDSQRPLLKGIFDSIQPARDEYVRLAAITKGWTTQDVIAMVDKPEFMQLQVQRDTARAIHVDGANVVILVVASSLERLSKIIEGPIQKKGAVAYNGVHFTQAIWCFANAYRHFGEWIDAKAKPNAEREKNIKVLRRLVDDPLSSRAPVQFLERCCNFDYADFERLWLSVLDDLQPEGPLQFHPAGEAGARRLELRLADA